MPLLRWTAGTSADLSGTFFRSRPITASFNGVDAVNIILGVRGASQPVVVRMLLDYGPWHRYDTTRTYQSAQLSLKPTPGRLSARHLDTPHLQEEGALGQVGWRDGNSGRFQLHRSSLVLQGLRPPDTGTILTFLSIVVDVVSWLGPLGQHNFGRWWRNHLTVPWHP